MKTDYRNYVHAAADLETLGLDDNAVVVSLGVAIVKWNPETGKFELKGDFYMNLVQTMFEQTMQGRGVLQSTVEWWREPRQQTPLKVLMDEAWKASKVCAPTIAEASDRLHDYLKSQQPDRKKLMLWGNGAGFDCNKIESLLPKASVPFRLHRDLRTVLDDTRVEVVRDEGVDHHARYDAINQALALKKALNRLERLHQTFESDSVWDENE